MNSFSNPNDLSVGAHVVVSDPNNFVSELRNKIKGNRVGEIVRVNEPDFAVVVFPSLGRRREFRHTFRLRYLSPAPAQEAEAAPARRKPGP